MKMGMLPLVFHSDREGGGALYRATSPNSQPQRLFSVDGLTSFDLLPDGQAAVAANGQLIVMGQAGARTVHLGDFYAQFVVADPLSAAVYVAGVTRPPQPGRLCRVHLDESRVDPVFYLDAPLCSLAVSPDGQRLAYTVPRGQQDELLCLDLDRRWGPRRLIGTVDDPGGERGGRYRAPCFSPDGSRILYSMTHISSTLKVIRADGKSRSHVVDYGFISAIA